MISEARSGLIYITVILSLFYIDYLLGNGFVVTFQRMFCKVFCCIRKYIREERYLQITGNEHLINLPVVVSEIVFLGLTIAVIVDIFCGIWSKRAGGLMESDYRHPWTTGGLQMRCRPLRQDTVLFLKFLNKYKQHRGKDKIDDLLQESREALRQTNEFLEKWRLRRINWQVPSEYSYLDEEPQEIKPLKLEVPILHMAIVDTLGSSRNRTERGDAGDMISSIDSTLLSMTSLLDDDLQSIPEILGEEKIDTQQDTEIRDRYLWDVLEEDTSLEEL